MYRDNQPHTSRVHSNKNMINNNKYFTKNLIFYREFSPIKAFEKTLTLTKTIDMRPTINQKQAVQPHQKGAQSACKKYPVLSKLPLLEQLHIRIKERAANLESSIKARKTVAKNIEKIKSGNSTAKHVIIHSPQGSKDFHLTTTINFVNNGGLNSYQTRNSEPSIGYAGKNVKPLIKPKQAF